jgi:uncharacterized damage-inducible protein DinB
METTADLLRYHLDYTDWASKRLIDAAGRLGPAELTKDFGTADHSILGTLVHIYAADRAWLGRIQGNPPARFLDPERDLHLAVLQNDWPPLLTRWKEWGATLTESSIRNELAYKDSKGNPFVSPIWQIVMQVVNHGTHHRGQVSGFVRALGYEPPRNDLIAYYRERFA